MLRLQLSTVQDDVPFEEAFLLMNSRRDLIGVGNGRRCAMAFHQFASRCEDGLLQPLSPSLLGWTEVLFVRFY